MANGQTINRSCAFGQPVGRGEEAIRANCGPWQILVPAGHI